MFTAFGFLALIVAGWGLYSVLAFDVAVRQHELCIRSALGAGVARLVYFVLRQAVLFVLAGVGIGLFASCALLGSIRARRSRPTEAYAPRTGTPRTGTAAVQGIPTD